MLDPQELAALAAQAKEVLAYAPDLQLDHKPVTEVAAPPSTTTTIPVPVVAAQEHAVALLATYHDVHATSAWIAQTLQSFEQALQGVAIPTNSPALTGVQQLLVETALSGQTITFGDVQAALAHPEDPASTAILTAWRRYQWGYDGRLDAFFYTDIWRYAKKIHPILVQATDNLIVLSNYAILGQTTSAPLPTHLDLLTTAAESTASPDPNVLISYQKTQDTLAAMNSEITYTISGIKGVLDAELPAANDVRDLVLSLSQAIDTHHSGIGVDLQEAIQVLSSLRTVFEIIADAKWLDLSALESRLDGFVESLILQVVSEAVGMLGHVQAMLISPLINVIFRIDSVYNSVYNTAARINPKAQPGKNIARTATSIDKFGNSIATAAETIVERFESRLLEMYRHSSLHNSLVSSKTSKATDNVQFKNIVKMLDQVISYLQIAEQAQVEWMGIANSVGQFFTQSVHGHAVVAAVPSLVVAKPAPDASLTSVVTSGVTWGVVTKGKPILTARHLRELITGLGSP